MLNSDEISDSTDWLGTPLATLASIEASLRCQVCKDFYVTPMMTSCSHTFCSLCIRRYLSQEGKCPTCRELDQEVKLRRNWVVEELVEKFQVGRKEILDFARSAGSRQDERPAKRRKVQHNHEPARRSTRNHSKRQISQPVEDSPTLIEIVDSDEGSEYDDQPDKGSVEAHDGLISCPICGRRMKEASINSHLDSCIGGDSTNTSSPRRSNTPQIPVPATAPLQTKPIPRRERLPTINYSMLNDNALRKKLKDLGISGVGSKESMRRRHTEWVNLWNANCDARQPVSKPELLRELNQWERTLGRQADRAAAGVMVKDFDREGWQQSNKGDFDDLIAQARMKRAAAAASLAKSPSPLGAAMERDAAAPEPNPRDVPISDHAPPTGTGMEEASSWGRESHDAIFSPNSRDHGRSSNFDSTGTNVAELSNGALALVGSMKGDVLNSRGGDLTISYTKEGNDRMVENDRGRDDRLV